MSISDVFEKIASRKNRYTLLPKRYVAIDTETTGINLFNGDEPYAVSTCDSEGSQILWRVNVDPRTRKPRWSKKQISEIENYIASFDCYVFHNAKFDIRSLGLISPNLFEILTEHLWGKVRCTLIYSHIADSQEVHKLKPLAKKYLGIDDQDEQELKKETIRRRREMKRDGYEVAEDVQSDYWMAGNSCDEYVKKDAFRTALLFPLYVKQLRKMTDVTTLSVKGKKYNIDAGWNACREHLLMPYVYDMEQRGIEINRDLTRKKCREFSQIAIRRLDKATATAHRSGMPKPFNPGSPKQLSVLLFDKWGIQPQKWTNAGNTSTDAETLESIRSFYPENGRVHQFLDDLLEGRAYEKAASDLSKYDTLTVTRKIGDTISAKLHSSLNQTGTKTPRFSSSNPNLQNANTDEETSIRDIFGPEQKHYWINPDYDNLEMRILAHISNEKRLLRMFERGESYHVIVAEMLFGKRENWKELNKNDWKKSPEYKRTKNGNFAGRYNAGRKKVDATYGVPGAYDLLRNEFSEWAAYNDKKIVEAETNGCVKTLFGYVLQVSKERAFTTALNYTIQGTAGCAMKYAMLTFALTAEKDDHPGKMVLTIHDELITEWPDHYDKKLAAKYTKDAMEAPGTVIKIPLPVKPILIEKKWTEGVPIECD